MSYPGLYFGEVQVRNNVGIILNFDNPRLGLDAKNCRPNSNNRIYYYIFILTRDLKLKLGILYSLLIVKSRN